MRLLPLILFALACAEDPKTRRGAADQSPPGEDFLKDTDVRLRSPSRGETLDAEVTASWEAGADVAQVALAVDGETVWGPQDAAAGEGELSLSLETGRRTLTLLGLDEAGETLSSYEIFVRVTAEGETWVSFVSPADGATLPNPVTFVVDASEDVASIVLSADGWDLGEVAPGEPLTYTFTGTGYERELLASGLDAGGEVVATDAIALTVEEGSSPERSSFNELVVAILETYPRDGTHGYYWPSDGDWYGTTRDVWYLDELVAEGDPYGRAYCVGLTWEVFMRAFDEADRMTGGDGSLNGMDVDDLTDFRVDWFVRDLWGDGAGVALEDYGLGDAVTDPADLEPGDFLQFWRYSGSGHSVIFIDWELDDDGDIVGIQYWSTQSSTDGIDYNSEYFGSGGSSIDPSYFYAARARMPEDWSGWR